MESASFVVYACAVCGSQNETMVDVSAGVDQSFVEDCVVCCRPNVLRLRIDLSSGEASVDAEFEG